MTLLEALIKIRDDELVDPYLGICYRVHTLLADETKFSDLAEKWPKFSGRRAYPIPNPSGGCPKVAFDDAVSTTTGGLDCMWNPDHPYGALRLELLNWCIEQLSTSE